MAGAAAASSQHPDGDQVPHYTPMIGKVNGDACADILLPHRLGAARDGDYQLRTFLAVCDGSKNAQWTRTTTRAALIRRLVARIGPGGVGSGSLHDPRNPSCRSKPMPLAVTTFPSSGTG